MTTEELAAQVSMAVGGRIVSEKIGRGAALIEDHDREILASAAGRAGFWMHEWIDAYSDYEAALSELRDAILGGKP
jgi:hypothetical protein